MPVFQQVYFEGKEEFVYQLIRGDKGKCHEIALELLINQGIIYRAIILINSDVY